jgi:hypothetical protein
MSADRAIFPAQLAVGTTADRVARVSPSARAVHRTVLRAFAATGRAPTPDDLVAATGGDEVGALLRELHEHDVLRLDENGAIVAAYPFSGRTTAHRVDIHDGPTVHAMCAVDALGIAEMLGRDTTVRSTDPATGQPISVIISRGRATWSPDTAVVLVGSVDAAPVNGGCRTVAGGPAGDPIRAAADRCCGVMNFFAGVAGAEAWLAAHPAVSGVVLNKDDALSLGVLIFGGLLRA